MSADQAASADPDGPSTADSAGLASVGRFAMGVELMWASEPVLRDCEHTGIPVELVRQHLAAGAPVIPMMNIESNIVQVAMVVQRYLAGSGDTPHRQRTQADIRGWPQCARYPHQHQSRALVIEGIACWVCPEIGAVSTAIGSL